MDKLEYIPGDIVSVYVGIKKYIVKIIGVEYENEVLSYRVEFTNGEIQYADKDNIVPIPLTLEILEKNGWNQLNNAYGLYTFEHPEEEWFELILEPDGWKAYCLDIGISNFFNSVHELQHLLFGLGLNHKMKV